MKTTDLAPTSGGTPLGQLLIDAGLSPIMQ